MSAFRIALFFMAFGGLAVPAVAHPLSTTTVTITADSAHTLVVTLTMDADALIAKLDARSPSSPFDIATTDEELSAAARIRQRAAALLEALELRAGGRTVPLAVESVRVDGQRDATIVLKGAAPERGATLEWQMSLALATYALSVTPGGGQATVQWVSGSAPSAPVVLGAAGVSHTIARSVALGFTHIVPLGLDHVLFVVGLALVGTRRRSLLLLVTAFTLAHSVTLGLGLYGVVSVPSKLVEPLIALSIAYVGIENLTGHRHVSRRVALVFLFGLLHGLGFAAVLADLTTSATTRLATLGAFNLGVELGQIVVLMTTLGGLALARRLGAGGDLRLASAGSAAVAVMGTVWTVQRIFGG